MPKYKTVNDMTEFVSVNLAGVDSARAVVMFKTEAPVIYTYVPNVRDNAKKTPIQPRTEYKVVP